MHDAAHVHVLERRADLNEVLPDGLLGDQPLLLLEMLRTQCTGRAIRMH